MLKLPTWDAVRVPYTAKLEGTVNGYPANGHGTGTLQIEEGVVDGDYTFDRFNGAFHPFILNAVMVTGYPSVCKASPETHNPFYPGSYSYEREIDFGRHGRVSYVANCVDARDEAGNEYLDSRFALDARVHVPGLTDCQPIVETWVPVGPGRIDGCFTIAWRTADNGYVAGVARTAYSLPSNKPLEGVHFRSIKLRNSKWSHTRLALHQESRLMSDQEW